MLTLVGNKNITVVKHVNCGPASSTNKNITVESHINKSPFHQSAPRKVRREWDDVLRTEICEESHNMLGGKDLSGDVCVDRKLKSTAIYTKCSV